MGTSVGGKGVTVSETAVGTGVEVLGMIVGGVKVGKPGSGVGVEGGDVSVATHANKMGNTNKIESRFIINHLHPWTRHRLYRRLHPDYFAAHPYAL